MSDYAHKIIKLANRLDFQGNFSYANYLDWMILKLAVRPIPIDKEEISGVTNRFLDALQKMIISHRLKKLPKPNLILHQDKIKIHSVDGDELLIDVYFVTKDVGNSPLYPFNGGTLTEKGGKVLIAVYLDPTLPIKEILENIDGTFRKGVASILYHEVTHIAESKFTPEGPADYYLGKENVPAAENIDRDKYYNDPYEVRAFMQQIVDEVLDLEKTISPEIRNTILDSKNPGVAMIKYLLDHSKVYQTMLGYLKPENKKKIILAVVDAMEGAGMFNTQKTAGQIPAGMQRSILETGMFGKSDYDSLQYSPESDEQSESSSSSSRTKSKVPRGPKP